MIHTKTRRSCALPRRELFLEQLEQRCLLAGDIGAGIVHGQLKIGNGTPGIPVGSPSVFEFFGSSITSLGDIDGDNIGDLAVGAPRIQGAVYILRMTAGGGVKSSLKITDGRGGLPAGTLAEYDHFGTSVASIDLDRDGIRELIVGATGDHTYADSSGVVYVLSLNADGSVKSHRKLITGSHDGFAMSLASIGDFNRDGIEDLAVGETFRFGGSGRHAVHLLMLNSDGTIKSKMTLDRSSPGLGDLSQWENFGMSITALGDLDGDHVIDLAVGASADDTGGSKRGAVYLLLMNADGKPRVVRKIADGSGLAAGTLRDHHEFGYSLAFMGDSDGDGVPELAVGAEQDTNETGRVRKGAIHLLTLNVDGTVKSSRKIVHPSDTLPPEKMNTNEQFGSSLVWLGDIGIEGASILASGGAFDDQGEDTAGALFLFNLGPTDWQPNPNSDASECHSDSSNAAKPRAVIEKTIGVHSFTKIAERSGGFSGLNANDEFGASVANIGDLDGDGNADLVVGALHDDSFRQGLYDDQGAAYVLFLKRDGTVRESRKITAGSAGLSLKLSSQFGSSVAPLGDVDRDGVIDLAVSAPQDNTGSLASGAVYLLFMKRDGTVKAHQKIADNTNGLGKLRQLGYFGSSVAGLGDLDGDGVPDLAVGALGVHAGGINKGAVYVLFLNSDGTVKRSRQIGHETSGLGALEDYGLFGQSISSPGDLNRDGIADLAVGAPYDDENGLGSGAFYILFLDRDGSVQASQKVTGPYLHSGFGSSLTSIGDLNQDGILDLLVGASTEVIGTGGMYALLMQVDGKVQAWARIGMEESGFIPLRPGDAFGKSVAALGDLDRDGRLDLAVGAPGNDANCSQSVADCRFQNSGAYYVLHLAPIDWKPTPVSNQPSTSNDNDEHDVNCDDTTNNNEDDAQQDDDQQDDETSDDDSNNQEDGDTGEDSECDGANTSITCDINDAEVEDETGTSEGTEDDPTSTEDDSECDGIDSEITCGVIDEDVAEDSSGQNNEDNVEAGDSECNGSNSAITCDITDEGVTEEDSSGQNNEGDVEVGDSECDGSNSAITCENIDEGAPEDISNPSDGSQGNSDVTNGCNVIASRLNCDLDLSEAGESEDKRIFALLEVDYAWLTAQADETGTTGYGLHLGGGGQHVDLTDVDASQLPNLEVFDIRGEGDNALSLSVQNVENISASHQLTVHADAGDTVQIGSGWLLERTEIKGDSFVRIFTQNDAVLRMDGPYDWSNPANPLDVNVNGLIEPRDALNIINAINSRTYLQANGALVDAASLNEFPGLLLDAQPDGFLVPRDALAIINYLNEHPRSMSQAEGEGGDEESRAIPLAAPQTVDAAMMELLDSIASGPPGNAERNRQVCQIGSDDALGTSQAVRWTPYRAQTQSSTDDSLSAFATAADELCTELEQTA